MEIKQRLYELEISLSDKDFVRISKSQIVNINKIRSLKPEQYQKTKTRITFYYGFSFCLDSSSDYSSVYIAYYDKKLFTFCCSAPLVLFAYLFSHLLKIDFQNKGNLLSVLGLLISFNQLLYILIAMWIYAAMPEKMLMVYAMIFGAHLLPYGWLYQSKSYYVFSVIIPFVVLLLGIYSSAIAIAIFMLVTEVLFCVLLIIENKKVEFYEMN